MYALTVIMQILIVNFEEQMGKEINVLTYKSEQSLWKKIANFYEYC